MCVLFSFSLFLFILFCTRIWKIRSSELAAQRETWSGFLHFVGNSRGTSDRSLQFTRNRFWWTDWTSKETWGSWLLWRIAISPGSSAPAIAKNRTAWWWNTWNTGISASFSRRISLPRTRIPCRLASRHLGNFVLTYPGIKLLDGVICKLFSLRIVDFNLLADC